MSAEAVVRAELSKVGLTLEEALSFFAECGCCIDEWKVPPHVNPWWLEDLLWWVR